MPACVIGRFALLVSASDITGQHNYQVWREQWKKKVTCLKLIATWKKTECTETAWHMFFCGVLRYCCLKLCKPLQWWQNNCVATKNHKPQICSDINLQSRQNPPPHYFTSPLHSICHLTSNNFILFISFWEAIGILSSFSLFYCTSVFNDDPQVYYFFLLYHPNSPENCLN